MAKQASPSGLKRFLDYRYGMFIHWGLYSILANGEWTMHNQKIAVSEYEKLVPQFNPIRFNAEEWVSIAADAGQKYMVITSRHHDGFSMYNTALSEYKVTNTPFKRDPLMELANACAKRGDVRLGFYSSLLDWHHPAYRFRKESGLAWEDYLAFLHGQVRELCTDYGDLACLWFDGDWPHHPITSENEYFMAGGSFEYASLYDLIHTLQPEAVVINNRHEKPLPGEDIQGFEQDLPGDNTAGFNTTEQYELPYEVCMTINDSWGVNSHDENHKSTRRLAHILARSASLGANYLLNVGPTAEGEILPLHAHRLRQIGSWIKTIPEAIYGSRAGCITSAIPGVAVSTQQGNLHHVFILQDLSDQIVLKGVPASIQSARVVPSGLPIKLERKDDLAVITLPCEVRDPMCSVVQLSD